jgi:hypothetical protein
MPLPARRILGCPSKQAGYGGHMRMHTVPVTPERAVGTCQYKLCTITDMHFHSGGKMKKNAHEEAAMFVFCAFVASISVFSRECRALP